MYALMKPTVEKNVKNNNSQLSKQYSQAMFCHLKWHGDTRVYRCKVNSQVRGVFFNSGLRGTLPYMFQMLTHLLQMVAVQQKPVNQPSIKIRCTEAWKHLKHAGSVS
ncbi:hypothetical protein ILYODFUR_002817 [Ilyodon furcidens]|uniref:Uncharacterized protein n=1 Tax=Ilyodon furcidens TaxID=33524 RepID=A0ABV0V0M1_9TELE